ncbi:DUF7146 domain-containing protein [Lichenifustis flavocetrariae]|uniref:Toprim domain-containing protein n=1 Tax=Lichenifustis flavocetrariae TaxID=2949735 RepID=A0AA42CQC6_9HYPH|nr:toprim domain-containing protein [Lichenifustis flavocetrariae]MCW6511315.1 toprim domain-containing protein [Lichenifustis flavocetrariae]
MTECNASDLARHLAQHTEAVCRHYLPAGRRQGRYWIVGDVRNTPGRSTFVRLVGSERGKGAAGKWSDPATGEYGDLLDLIGASCGLVTFSDVVREACRFLSLPRPASRVRLERRRVPAAAGSPQAAQRLFALSRPIDGTLAETYLRSRDLDGLHETAALRFHPACRYKHDTGPDELWPAMIAAVTDVSGDITGVQRTYLSSDGRKAPVDSPRRALGYLLGHAVRFGTAAEVMAAGEGIETMLSLRCVLPTMPMLAALSAAHLAAVLFPPTLRRLYIASDLDTAGRVACDRLFERAQQAGIEAIALRPWRGDFNDDLFSDGPDALLAHLRVQLAAEDVERFTKPAAPACPGLAVNRRCVDRSGG